jgi:APA family basic amino acid/polyamine antiporter
MSPANAPDPAAPPGGQLLRILGAGFGIAVIIGGTIGVGILRTPGEIARQLGSVWLVLAIWLLGGVYVLLGAICVSELGTMLPQAGGFYVYARRALGDTAGLLVGCSDWLGQTAAIAYLAVAFAEFLQSLVPPLKGGTALWAVLIITLLALLQWTGLRASSRAQEWTSLVKCLAFTAVIAGCFAGGGNGALAAPLVTLGPVAPWALFAGIFVALESVIVTYDGWYAAVYFTEENRDPSRSLPRAMIGGVVLVIVIYLLVNLGLLYILPFRELADSSLPAASAATRLFGPRGGAMIVALSLVSLVPVLNAVLMCSTRVLFGLSRDGLLWPGPSYVDARGTPSIALLLTAVTAAALAVTGTFAALIAVAGFIFVVNHCSAYVSILVLRRREPALIRPFRAGPSLVAMLALGGGVSFLLGAAIGDPIHSAVAVALVAAGWPVSRLVRLFAGRQRLNL